MKQLKRMLSLCLAVALAMSLAVTASAASYSSYADAEDVTYEEAMDVLVALGIIEGSDGNLDPKDTFTREQAAKIIAYLCLGKATAETMVASGQSFSDVEVTRWSAGYISYCANVGIINGLGNGTFNPTGTVTGTEFAKMLLAAIGYGSQGEFEGMYWAVNTNTYATEIDMFDGSVGVSLVDPITREEAMLYAFNVLTNAMLVNWSDLTDTYYSGKSPLSEVDEDDEYKYTLGYNVFGLEKSDEETDSFGRTYYTWLIDGEEISDDYYGDSEDLVMTATSYLYMEDIYDELGKEYAGLVDSYLIDGEEMIKDGELTGDTGSSYKNAKIVKDDDDHYFGGRGVETMVFVNDDDEVIVIEVHSYLAEVADVSDDEITVKVFGGDSYDVELDNASDFEEDQYVQVTIDKDEDEIDSVETVTSFTGSIIAYGSSYFNVDGTKYYPAWDIELNDASDRDDFDSKFTFYLDEYGYVLGTEMYEEGEDELEYLYVSDSAASEYSALDGKAYVKAAVTFADGTSDVVYIYVKNAAKTSATYWNGEEWTEVVDSDEEDAEDPFTPGFYAYSVNSSDYYTLDAVDEDDVYDDIDLNDGSSKVKLDSKVAYATGSTKLILMDTGKVYDGYSEFPDVEDLDLEDDYEVLAVKKSSGKLAYIYIMGDTDASESFDFAYYNGYGYRDDDGYHYCLLVGGEENLYLFDSKITAAMRGDHDIVALDIDEDGISTITPVTDETYGYSTLAVTVEDVEDEYFEAVYETEYTVYYKCEADGTIADDAEAMDALPEGAEEITDEDHAADYHVPGEYYIKAVTEEVEVTAYFFFGDDDYDCEIYDVDEDGAAAELSDGDEAVIAYFENDDGDLIVYAIYING